MFLSGLRLGRASEVALNRRTLRDVSPHGPSPACEVSARLQHPMGVGKGNARALPRLVLRLRHGGTMPDARLAVIDDTAALTTAWLDEIARRTGTGPALAYHVLAAGLHALRDRLTAEEAARLAQDLPTLVRGIYFDGWRPAETPVRDPSLAAWLVTLEGRLLAADADTVPPRAAAEAVFALLKAHLSDRATRRLAARLPDDVAALLRAA
jgi:uncharacterized protein (DUF2267 family)